MYCILHTRYYNKLATYDKHRGSLFTQLVTYKTASCLWCIRGSLRLAPNYYSSMMKIICAGWTFAKVIKFLRNYESESTCTINWYWSPILLIVYSRLHIWLAMRKGTIGEFSKNGRNCNDANFIKNWSQASGVTTIFVYPSKYRKWWIFRC